MEKLLDLIYNGATDWEKVNRKVFDSLFGQGGAIQAVQLAW